MACSTSSSFCDQVGRNQNFLEMFIPRYQAKMESKARLATGQALASAPEKEVQSSNFPSFWMVFKFITGHKVVEARVAELPAWVFFPDVERVEWVNRFAASYFHYFISRIGFNTHCTKTQF